MKDRVAHLSTELNLDNGVSKNKIIGSITDSEDFTSDSGIISETCDHDGDVLVLAIADNIPFEPGLNLETPTLMMMRYHTSSKMKSTVMKK